MISQQAILVSLVVIAVGAMAYGVRQVVDDYVLIGDVTWHICACLLIGCLEVLFLSIRVEDIRRRQLNSVYARTATIVVLILLSWHSYVAHPDVTSGIESFREHSFASVTYLIAFPTFCILGLLQVAIVGIRRFPADIKRRPISAIAMAMVSLGICGFIWINLTLMFYLNTGYGSRSANILQWSPAFLFVSVTGAAILAFGERAFDEIVAQRELRRLQPLWGRLIELSDHDLHLSVENLSTPARLQRAYVEISDAICTVRLKVSGAHTLESVAEALHAGSISDDSSVPTLSRGFPERATRRDDLALIGSLATAYRKWPQAPTGSTSIPR